MAQIKISELELNTQMSNEDVLAGVDTSEQKTKKFKLETLKTFINKEQDEQITKNKNDISANATNIETNAKDISNNSKNIEKNTQDIVENKKNIADNTNRTKRIENTLYDSGEASGTSINIKDSTLAEFQEITIDGVCEQETTDGKNLANDNDIKGTIIGGNKSIPNISVNENEVFSITLSQTLNEKGTGGTNNDYIAQHNLKWLDENENVISQSNFLMMTFSSVGETKTLSNTGYVAPVGAKYLKLDVGSYFSNSCKLIHNYIQVEKGPVATEYEPYTGGQASPSPEYPQPIEVIDEDFEVKSSGKNLLNIEPYSYTHYGITTDFDGNKFKIKGTAASNWAFLSPIILSNLEIGTYTLSKYKETPFQIMLILENEEKRVMTKYLGKPATEVDFSLNEKATKITLGIDGITAGDEIDVEIEVQVEKGSISTEYEAPISSRVPINLPDGEFVGKIDENAKDQVRIAFNEEKGEYRAILEKKIGKVILDGSESWDLPNNQNSNGNYNTSYFTTSLPDIKPDGKMLSNYFAFKYLWNNDVVGIWVGGSKFLNIRISKTIANTTASFKEWLSENNVEAYYELSEPYEVDLGIVDMPLSYSPETNVFTTSELEALINAKYYRNFINTIQNLQVNEKALKEELVDINSRLSALETNLVNMASVQEVESEGEE